jgi:nucleoside-diphosphate-sugar epimerase
MILITGANGFVGKELCSTLLGVVPIRACMRNDTIPCLPAEIEIARVDLADANGWKEALSGINVIVHCAARVHVMNDDAGDPLVEFRRINVEGTLRLAELAAEMGVRRFIYLSSVKVNGERTSLDSPFTADQNPAPIDPYGISKYEAELGLRQISKWADMEIVIIRPPLVYGPGVKANFLSMMKWLQRGIPLPLGGIVNNRRSLVYIKNLVDLIVICITHPKAVNQTFLVSDDEDVSTYMLLRKMSEALGLRSRLIRVFVAANRSRGLAKTMPHRAFLPTRCCSADASPPRSWIWN